LLPESATRLLPLALEKSDAPNAKSFGINGSRSPHRPYQTSKLLISKAYENFKNKLYIVLYKDSVQPCG
jgi:hypothetical protein